MNPSTTETGQNGIGLLAELLTAVKPHVVAADREWQKVLITDAPEFRALAVLGPDENGLSDIIAELLNPRGSHGQGQTFLDLFALRCGRIGKHSKQRVKVHREYSTSSNSTNPRRIDIVIDGTTWGIGIENKPWAGEADKQLGDYADDLEKRFGDNYLLIRLAGRDVDATSISAERQEILLAQGTFTSWQYVDQLLAWVDDCRQVCKAPRVTSFLDDFFRYITAEFGPAKNLRADMERKHLLIALETILEKDPSQFQSAAAIADVFPEVRQKFVSDLFNEIGTDVLATLGVGWTEDRMREKFVETDWAYFSFTHKDWFKLYQVRLESQPKFSLVVLGVWHDGDKGIKRDDTVQQDLRRLGWGHKGGGRFWDALSPLPEPFTDWTTSAGIAAVVQGRAALKTFLTEEIVKLCQHFQRPLAKLANVARPESN